MDKSKRKELMEQYKQIKTMMGILQIKNNQNGKIYIDSCSNLKNRWMSIKMQLEGGRHPNLQLQREWQEFGEDAFSYEVLMETSTEDIADIKWELSQLEKQWLEKLQPYGEKGYNKPPR